MRRRRASRIRGSRFSPGQGVPAEELDPILAVGPDRFERVRDALVRRLDEGRATIRFAPIPVHEGQGSGAAEGSPAGAILATYRAEVERVETMDRREEVRLAKRVDLVRHRLLRALRASGFPSNRISRALVAACDHEGRRGSPSCVFAEATDEAREALHERKGEYESARNEMVERSLELVLRLVDRYRGLGVPTLDLIQEANASLFKAVEGYDWRRGVRFRTYATFWVNQAFLNLLYNTGRTVRVPAYIQKAMKKINEAKMAAGSPTADAETIAAHSGLAVDFVRHALAGNRYSLSLDRELRTEDPGDGRRLLDLLEDPRVGLDLEAMEEGALVERLREALRSLSPRERLIVELRYGLHGSRPHTLAEVGKILGVSLERVRQLQEVALGKMRGSRGGNRLEQFVS